jgi:hypothetical protein
MRRWMIGLALLGLLVVLGAGAWFSLRGAPPELSRPPMEVSVPKKVPVPVPPAPTPAPMPEGKNEGIGVLQPPRQ